jgi:hypothetical protein
MNVAAGGDFWVPVTPGVTVSGAFKADAGSEPELVLARGVVGDPRVAVSVHGGITYASGGVATIKASLPITVQGRLDSGESVTLVNAQNWGGPGPPFENPSYKAHYAIVGDRTVSGADQLFSSMRFRFGEAYWLGHLRDGDASAVGGDGSTLCAEQADDGNWLVYSSATPVTQRRLESMVVLGCVALAELALDQEFEARDTQVRINDGDPWLTVHGPGANRPPKESSFHTLLPREVLTIERFAKWIPINDTLDGLASAVTRPVAQAPLQSEVLIVTALLEGLHRRLHSKFQQSKFPDASGGALDRIRQAARRAANAKAADEQNLDPDKVRTAVKDAVGHFDQVDYLRRAEDVVTTVCGAIPEINESVAALPKRLKDARNEMAHQLPLDHEEEPLEVRYLRWLVVSQVTPWLLRGLLLLEAGVEPSLLHDQHLAHNRFFYFRANVAQFVEGLGWELPETSRDIGPGQTFDN